MEIDTAATCLVSTRDKSLHIIESAVDKDYRDLLSDVLTGTRTSHYARQAKSIFDHLSVDHGLVLLDAKRIVVPLPAVKEIIRRLHFSHCGFTKTYEYA